MRIIIDFDNTIAKPYKYPLMGQPFVGVKDALQRFRDAGHTIAIHSCRNSKDVYDRESMRVEQTRLIASYMNRHGLPYDEIIEFSKPVADVYIDDRAMRFGGEWSDIADSLIQ